MFQWIKTAARRLLNSGVKTPAQWLIETLVNQSDSGVSVNANSAITLPPVWYALKKISGHVVQMPLTPLMRVDGGSVKDKSHPAYRLLRQRANPYQSAASFMETLIIHALLWGNGKAAIIRNENGQPEELIIIPADRSATLYASGAKYHCVEIREHDRLGNVRGSRGATYEGNRYVIPDRDVLHIPGMGLSGDSGLAVFEVARNAISLGLSAERAAIVDFQNGSKPGMLLEAPQNVLDDDKDAQEYIDNFNRYHSGLDNKGRAGLLRHGITANVLSGSSEQSSWVEHRRFQRQEMALLFSLEQILGDDSSVSYNSLEQKNLAYLSNCLMPWLVKIEQECGEKLLSMRQKSADSHFFKFNTAALLRSDYRSTVESLSTAIRSRILNPNEAREKLDLLPYEGGEIYANPAIYVPEDGDGTEQHREQLTPEDANHTAIVSHLRHMIGVEAKHVLNAAGNKKNYVGWIDRFYDEKWTSTLTRAIESYAGDEAAVLQHCQQSREELIEITGTVTPEGLADAVAEVVEKWPSRAEKLADSITRKLDHV